ncbi:MAG: ROK family transcriptional regulator [Myxococcales bacterium]|nr:ROK family transcriptional regulator [Myxococcales bacterium]
MSRVLRQLWLSPGMSRSEIADQLGLNRSTLTHIIKGLTEQGIVEVLDGGTAGPNGGRKNVRLAVNQSFGCYAGLDVQSDRLRAVLVNIGGDILCNKDFKGRFSGKKVYNGINKAYDWAKQQTQYLNVPLMGIGCAFGGIIDPEQQVIRQSIPLDIMTPEPVGQELHMAFDVPVLIDNDANCCCWAESVARRSAEPTSFLFVLGAWRTVRKPTVREITAVGMGISIKGSVHRGKDCSAGEFKSIEWKPGRTSQFSLPDEEVSAVQTDRKKFLKLSRELARNTSLIVNILDLNYLYLGGFFDENDEAVRAIFQQETQRNWSYPNKPPCEVKFSTFGQYAVAYGAAALFLVRTFGPNNELALMEKQTGVNLLLN